MTPREQLASTRKELLSLEKELADGLRSINDRRRAETVRLLHEIRSMLDPVSGYASQAGQDRIIDRIFKGKRGGTFVDVGGYDGLTGSNTLFFERARGWTGILVEPVESFRKMAEAERLCPCLPYAVSKEERQAAFMAVTSGFTQMSGLIENYDPQLLSRVREDSRHKEEEITVATRSLSSLLAEHNLENPDFISLDIEGGELAVLADFPFAGHCVGAWAIENNSATSELGKIMKANDYKLIEFCGPDEIYAHSSLV